MKLVIQRVENAEVCIEKKIHHSISKGLLVFLGIGKNDNESDIKWIIQKLMNLRLFEDENGKINYSNKDIKGEILVISQFTLMALTKKGNRPSFIEAMPPIEAKKIYDQFLNELSIVHSKVKSGIFGADMKIKLVNSGPFTILLDSKNRN